MKKQPDENTPKAGKDLSETFGKVLGGIASKAKDLASKTEDVIMDVIDTNDDGKFTLDDIGLTEENIAEAKEKAKFFASSTKERIKSDSEILAKALVDAKVEMDKKNLRPVFASDLEGIIPSMVCIVAQDKKRLSKDVCAGAIGYRTTVKGMEILNLYEDCANDTRLQFYPDSSKSVYYVDPFQKGLFINLDEYFYYFKKARVSELQRIAQDLGAKRVQITFKEYSKTSAKSSIKAEAKIAKQKEGASYDKTNSECVRLEIAADIKFSGFDIPAKPKLVYFKNEGDIEELIQMRTGDSQNKISSKTYVLQCSKSFGIKENEAAQIDAVLGQLKYTATASISKEAKRENQTELEYSIEF